MAIKRRYVEERNNALQDALLKSEKGQKLVYEAKAHQTEVGDRIRQLKELVHSTFVEHVPESCKVRTSWVYFKAKDKIRELGIAGGPEYDRVLRQVKYTWAQTPATFQEAITALGLK